MTLTNYIEKKDEVHLWFRVDLTLVNPLVLGLDAVDGEGPVVGARGVVNVHSLVAGEHHRAAGQYHRVLSSPDPGNLQCNRSCYIFPYLQNCQLSANRARMGRFVMDGT